jgi:hypothetical protein
MKINYAFNPENEYARAWLNGHGIVDAACVAVSQEDDMVFVVLPGEEPKALGNVDFFANYEGLFVPVFEHDINDDINDDTEHDEENTL